MYERIMCGRFVNLTKTNLIKKKFDIDNHLIKNLVSYNFAPSQLCYIILKKDEINLDVAKWGYSFIEVKSNQEKNIINSRLETIRGKNIFKESYLKRKCILPINGYYEWSFVENKKIPFFIHIPPSEPMYLACIWKFLNFKKSDHKVFSIITKNANKNISKIHHRMPVVLSQEESEEYLYDYNSSFLNNNFFSSIESDLDFYPVSNFVNNPSNNSEKCIQPLN